MSRDGHANGKVVSLLPRSGNVPESLGLLNQPTGDEPLTVAGMLAALERIRGLRPRDTWRVCRMFVPDRITVAQTPAETFYFCHPDLFPKVAAAYFEQQTPAQRTNPLLGLNAVDLDPVRTDSPEYAAWRLAERQRCLAAFSRVMVASIKGGSGGEEA